MKRLFILIGLAVILSAGAVLAQTRTAWVGRAPTDSSAGPSFFDAMEVRMRRQVPAGDLQRMYLADLATDRTSCTFQPVRTIDSANHRSDSRLIRRYRQYFFTTGQCVSGAKRWQVLYFNESLDKPDEFGICYSSSGRNTLHRLGNIGELSPGTPDGQTSLTARHNCSVEPEKSIDHMMQSVFWYRAGSASQGPSARDRSNDRVRCIRECVNLDPSHDYSRCQRQCNF